MAEVHPSGTKHRLDHSGIRSAAEVRSPRLHRHHGVRLHDASLSVARGLPYCELCSLPHRQQRYVETGDRPNEGFQQRSLDQQKQISHQTQNFLLSTFCQNLWVHGSTQ